MKLALFFMVAACAWAQEVKFYRLEFNVKEMEDSRLVSAKKYTTFASTDEKGSGATVRAGTRVPITTTTGTGTSLQYYDVGVNIDVPSLREVGGHLVVRISAEVSSLPAADGAAAAPAGPPVVRQNRWVCVATLEPGKPVTLVSSDDLNSKRKMQLELTATLVK